MFYRLACFVLRLIAWPTLRIGRVPAAVAAPGDGYLLACNHASHLDPVCLSVVERRPISWMARREFFIPGWRTWLMRHSRTFSVHRQGMALGAVREGLRRLGRGEVVGVFPEGELKAGAESVVRGGPIKRGVCLLSIRSGRPVVPCVIVGAHTLMAVEPWLPFLRGRLYVIWGEPLHPPKVPLPGREARARMAAELERRFVDLYAELRGRFGLGEDAVP